MKRQKGQFHFSRLKRAFKRISGIIPKGKAPKRVRRKYQGPLGE